MPFAEVNGIRLYYEEEGQGTPVLLLHGALGAVDPAVSSGWGALVPSLAAQFRAISLELRGHGRSTNDSARLSYTQLVEDVAAFVLTGGLAPVHLVGFSLGAEAGLVLGLTRPELLRSLVCVGANYLVDDVLREALALFDPGAIEREAPALAAELARRHDGFHGAGYWRDLVRQIREIAEGGLGLTQEDMQHLTVPTLLIAGELDPMNGFEQALAMRRCIPRSELLVVNHAGMEGMDAHRVHATRADIVGPAILDFLSRHAA